VLAPATTTRDASICWSNERGELHDHVGERLKEAGYVLVPNGCDVRLSWSAKRHPGRNGIGRGWRSIRPHISSANLVVRTGDDSALIDELHWDFNELDVPDDDPDRLAVIFVNALSSSKKVAAIEPTAVDVATTRR
jgi:hypothetical protein